MRHSKFPFIYAVFFLFSIGPAHGTAQNPELVIWRGDTLVMLSDPLGSYLMLNEPREKLHPALKDGCSTALWRGYVGLWEVRDDKLYLLDIYLCGARRESIRSSIFGQIDTPILASWFSGQIFIESGKRIRAIPYAFQQIYEHEVVLEIVEGKIANATNYINGISPDDDGISFKPASITEELYKRMEWPANSKLSKKYKVTMHYEITERHKMHATIYRAGIWEGPFDELVVSLGKAVESMPAIQVFYYRGKPIDEFHKIEVVFSKQNKRRYANQ